MTFPASKRYVITNPPDDFLLLPTDQVACRVCLLKQKYICQQNELATVYFSIVTRADIFECLLDLNFKQSKFTET